MTAIKKLLDIASENNCIDKVKEWLKENVEVVSVDHTFDQDQMINDIENSSEQLHEIVVSATKDQLAKRISRSPAVNKTYDGNKLNLKVCIIKN